jgi:hypothetical protein
MVADLASVFGNRSVPFDRNEAIAMAALTLLFWARRSPFQTWFGIVGSTFVLGYVLIQAASFHHIDRFIDGRILDFKWNWVLEMGGIVIVLLGSEWRLAKLNTEPAASS